MKKSQLKHVLDEYDEKASWTFMHGYWPPKEINELHRICEEDLAKLKDEDDIPLDAIHHIDEVASHYEDQWTDLASDTLKEIEDILHHNHH